MGFSCGCDDSDLEAVYTEQVHTGHKTLRCCECKCEIAPGHVVNTTMFVDWHEDGPFEELTDDQQAELLEDASYYHACERCGDISDAFTDTGMCYQFGDMWQSYFDWLSDQGKAVMVRLKRYMPRRFRHRAVRKRELKQLHHNTKGI